MYRESLKDHHDRMHGLCVHGETPGECDKIEYTDPMNVLAYHSNRTAHNKGWYAKGERNFGEVISLMHAELSEALEEDRDGKPGYYEVSVMNGDVLDEKPEGWAVELCDTVIRIFDTLYEKGVDIDEVMNAKMAFNVRRPYKHGGKEY